MILLFQSPNLSSGKKSLFHSREEGAILPTFCGSIMDHLKNRLEKLSWKTTGDFMVMFWSVVHTVDGSEIPNNHRLDVKKPCK